MKETELMIGNWVNWHTFISRPHYCRIISLGQNEDLDCSPIPLGSDILKASGWHKETSSFWKGDNVWTIYYRNTEIRVHFGEEGYVIVYNGSPISCVLHDVHQLQNALNVFGLNELSDNINIEQYEDK